MIDTNKSPVITTSSSITENRIMAPILLGIAIFFSVIFVRPLYVTSIDLHAREAQASLQYEAQVAEYSKLIEIKRSGGANLSEKEKSQIDKINKKLDTKDIFAKIMLVDKFTRSDGITDAPISLGSVSIGEAVELPNGLSVTAVNITIQGSTIDTIVEYITYLTTETPYAFTIQNISLPIDTSPEGNIPSTYSLSLSLDIYSYE